MRDPNDLNPIVNSSNVFIKVNRWKLLILMTWYIQRNLRARINGFYAGYANFVRLCWIHDVLGMVIHSRIKGYYFFPGI